MKSKITKYLNGKSSADEQAELLNEFLRKTGLQFSKQEVLSEFKRLEQKAGDDKLVGVAAQNAALLALLKHLNVNVR
jgi:hypothetical protein